MADFERHHGIQLPAGYREFILQVGDGGAGPNYGVQPLAAASEGSTLSKPFPWTAERALTEREDEAWDNSPTGILVISEQGCGHTDFMVVNGHARFQIWSDYTTEAGPLTPVAESFTSWYVSWATRCIATIKRAPLLQQARIGMTSDELRGIFGEDKQRREGSADLPYSTAYYVGFTNTNASFSIRSDGRVKSINKMHSV